MLIAVSAQRERKEAVGKASSSEKSRQKRVSEIWITFNFFLLSIILGMILAG